MSNVTYYSGSFAGGLLLSLVLTPLVTRIARRLGVLDMPGTRKVHQNPIPRMGGVAIAAAMLLAAGLIAFFMSRSGMNLTFMSAPVVTVIAGACSLLILGFLDDLYGISSKYKLVALLVASGAVCASGASWSSLVIHGDIAFEFGKFSWPITMLWIVGVTVSMNFVDGLDGLAGGIAAIACGVLAIGASVGGDTVTTVLALSLLGSLTGFLFFNFNPASIFMGDCGSLFIGFTLSSCCVLASQHVGSTRSIFLPALVLIVPILDSAFTMIRRSVLQRRSLFSAERGHIHHRLLDIGLCHKHVVLVMYAVTAAAAVVAILCITGGPWAATISVLVFLLLIVELFRSSGSVRARETLAAIRHNRALGREHRRNSRAFEEMQLRFREAVGFEGWWAEVSRAAELLGFARAQMELRRRDNSEYALKWRTDDREVADNDSLVADVPIVQRRSNESVHIRVEVMALGSLESAGKRLALFSRLMSEHSLASLRKSDVIGGRFRKRQNVLHEDHPTEADADPASEKLCAESAFATSLKVAIVHDFLYTYAGAERVLEQLVNLFPHAELFSLIDFLPADQRSFIRGKSATTSFIQKLPWASRKHRAYLPLMPLAIEQLDVSGYDLVISSSYLAAKGVITRPDQLHICYCHTPVRFAWDQQNQYLGRVGLSSGIRSLAVKALLHYIRTWDVRSANGVDSFIANSDFVGRRIGKTYRRTSTTIHPPVDTDSFTLCEQKEDFYLTVSRLVPYKRVDLIVEAFRNMPGRRLVVVGDGPEYDRIKAIAGDNVEMVGHQTVERVQRYMRHAKAFVFAAEEDFGIVPVEAQACGTPVIAFGRGGATESIIEGVTGLFFREATAEAVQNAIEEFETQTWDPRRIRVNAERFSISRFRTEMSKFVKTEWARFLAGHLVGRQELGVSRDSDLAEAIDADADEMVARA